MNLSARQLRAFIALAEELHFTRAAQRCHLTQPAFSALIQGLEQDAGVRLFDRSTRHVSLTVEGEVLEASARRLLADMTLALDDVRDLAQRRRGRVTLAALPSLAAGWLPPLLAQFQVSYPGISLVLHDALLDPCLALVQGSEADFAVAAQRADMTGLTSEFLCADAFFVVCRDDHALAAQPAVTLDEALAWPWIAMARHSSVRKRLDQALGPQAPAPVLEVEHLATVTGLVKAGLGVALVPGMTLFHFERPGLVILPLADDSLRRSLYLVRRQGRSLSVAAQTLYDLLLAQAPLTPAGNGWVAPRSTPETPG